MVYVMDGKNHQLRHTIHSIRVTSVERLVVLLVPARTVYVFPKVGWVLKGRLSFQHTLSRS